MSLAEEIIGRRFGALVVEAAEWSDRTRSFLARTRCDCGGCFSQFSVWELTSGLVRHCRGKKHKQTYALLSRDSSTVKIGCSDRPEIRIADLQRMSPSPLVLIGLSDDNVESHLHSSLATRWSHGEWFRYDDVTAQTIASTMTRTNLEIMRFVLGKNGKVPCLRCGDSSHQQSVCNRRDWGFSIGEAA